MKIPWTMRWAGGFVVAIAALAVLHAKPWAGSSDSAGAAGRATLRVGFLPVT